ncbi:MAG: hypothetical protein LBV15_04195, partial [Planctomycetota bacterium]|nr:hypothetical protein [Planctomycetota bacterium]
VAAPVPQPVLNSLEYNTPLSDLVGPARLNSRPLPAPMPEYVAGGYVSDPYVAGAQSQGTSYVQNGQAPVYSAPVYSAPVYSSPVYSAPDAGQPYAGQSYTYQPPAYDLTAGAPAPAPYYDPSSAAAGSSWVLGEDFR